MRSINSLNHFFLIVTATLLVSMLLSSGVHGQGAPKAAVDQEARQFIDALYGKRIKAVQGTRTSDDDIALMEEMLDIAPTLPKKPDARSALFVQVIEMAQRSRAGYELALDALNRLVKHNPRHPSARASARLELFTAWYRGVDRKDRRDVADQYFDVLVSTADSALARGDHAPAKKWYSEAGTVHRVNRLDKPFDLRDKLSQVRVIEKLQQEAQQLRTSARAGNLSPDQARRLIVLLALEMDRFDEADRYAVFLKDADFAKGLKAATALGGFSAKNGLADHPPGHWSLAGNWYASLIDEPGLSEKAKKRTFEMALVGLRTYVTNTTEETIEKARDAIQLRQLDERFAEAYGPSESNAINVIKLMDPEKHVLRGGPYKTHEGQIETNSGSLLHLPVAGGDHYRLTVEIELIKPYDNGLTLWLPISGRVATLWLDVAKNRGTTIKGLSYIEDADFVRLEEGKPTVIQIEVKSISKKQAAIKLAFNDKTFWTWRGEAQSLTPPTYGSPPDLSHFSVRVDTDVRYRRIELVRITDK